MKRILFIKPSMITSVNPEVIQPLGPLYLASYLRKKSAFAVSLYDMRIPNRKGLEETAQDFRPDVVGFNALTVETKDTASLTRNSVFRYSVLV